MMPPIRRIEHLKGTTRGLRRRIEVDWRNFRLPQAAVISQLPLQNQLSSDPEQERGIILTPRQAEGKLDILPGHSSVSIGLNPGSSPDTVKVFRRQSYSRCGVSSQAEPVALIMPLFSRLSA